MADHQLSEGSPSLQTVFAGILSLLGVLLGAYIFSSPSPERVNVEDLRGTHRAKVLAELRKEEEAKLTTLAWAKKEEGLARVPIQVAMQVTARELAKKPQTVSSVKADPVIAVPGMPSAPEGAKVIQFPREAAHRADQDVPPPAASPAAPAPSPAAPAPGNSTPN